MRLVHKLALLGSLPLVAVGYVGFMFVRPMATRPDVAMVAASTLYNDASMASEACGASLKGLRTPTADNASASDPWPKVALDSWRPLLPKQGSITAHVTGTGVDFMDRRVTGVCRVRMTFAYRCAWDDNGRSVNFDCDMIGAPSAIVRE